MKGNIQCSRCKNSIMGYCNKFKKEIFKIIHNIDNCFIEKCLELSFKDNYVEDDNSKCEYSIDDMILKKQEELLDKIYDNWDSDNYHYGLDETENIEFDDILFKNRYRKFGKWEV